MSEENVELARSVAEMFNRREFNGFLALMAQDVRFQPQLGPLLHRPRWNATFVGLLDQGR